MFYDIIQSTHLYDGLLYTIIQIYIYIIAKLKKIYQNFKMK